MGNRIILLIGLYYLLGLNLYSQNNFSLSKGEVLSLKDSIHTFLNVYDVDSLPLLIVPYGDTDSVQYIDVNGDKRTILFPLENGPYYQGGADSIQAFVNRNSRIPPEIEINSIYLIFILFENNKIDNVRIYKRIGFKYNTYDYEIKRIALMMENNWIINNRGVDLPVGAIFPMNLP